MEMSNDLTFSIHIANVVTAANKLVGWALRTLRRRSKLVMLTIWKSLVQSKFDYTSQLWSPSDQASIGKLESVARHFTAKIDGMVGLDYWERLQSFVSTPRREEGSGTKSSSLGKCPKNWLKATRPHLYSMTGGDN
jgi:hypothetical protein